MEKLHTYKNYFIVSIFYLLAALVIFYPITLHIGTVTPASGFNLSDLYQNLWDIWWVKYAIFNLHTNVFYTKLLFWPVGSNLAYETLAPLNGIVSAPFQVFGVVFAYNLMYIFGFVLSGVLMFVLANYLTKNSYAAAISGFIFTFSAFHIAQSYHIHYIEIGWAPLFLYFFLKLINEKMDYKNIIGMSVAFALSTLMGNIEQTIMLFLLFLFMVITYAIYRETRGRIFSTKFISSIVVFAVLAFLIGSWNFVPLLNAVLHPGGLKVANSLYSRFDAIAWSISPGSFVLPSFYNGIFYKIGISSEMYAIYSPDPIEKIAYIGFTVLVLMSFAIIIYGKKMLPWIVGALIFALLSLGPPFGLYQIYHALPVISIIPAPGRFEMITSMFIAILGAYGAKALFENIQSSNQNLIPRRNITLCLFVVIILFYAVESTGIPIGNSSKFFLKTNVPPLYSNIGNISGNFSVLELPAIAPINVPDNYAYSGEAMYYTSVTHKPLIGGYISRQNSSMIDLLYSIPIDVQTNNLILNGTWVHTPGEYTNNTISDLHDFDVRFVIVQKAAFNQSDLSALDVYLKTVFGNPIYNDNTTVAFNTSNAIERYIQKQST